MTKHQCRECGHPLAVVTAPCTFSTGVLTHALNLEFWFCTNNDCGARELPYHPSQVKYIVMKERAGILFVTLRSILKWLAENHITVPDEVIFGKDVARPQTKRAALQDAGGSETRQRL